MSCERLRWLVTLLLLSLAVAARAQAPQPSKNATAKNAANNSEAAIRDVYDRWAKAFRAHDPDAIMALYAPGDAVVGYDIVPPLQYVGKEAYRKDYQEFLAQYDGPIEVEYRDMRIIAGSDVAFIHALERLSGTLKGGQKSDLWVRATSGLRKIDGQWLIVHDHVSVPADFETGKAVLDLKP
ncbi:MAG TPA: SgcJ/EcaC family oxidoreductase [Terriglobales bacterium]|nr:SgcJ/EcaC family oxidoreductase [Terriglobales bacterium]